MGSHLTSYIRRVITMTAVASVIDVDTRPFKTKVWDTIKYPFQKIRNAARKTWYAVTHPMQALYRISDGISGTLYVLGACFGAQISQRNGRVDIDLSGLKQALASGILGGLIWAYIALIAIAMGMSPTFVMGTSIAVVVIGSIIGFVANIRKIQTAYYLCFSTDLMNSQRVREQSAVIHHALESQLQNYKQAKEHHEMAKQNLKELPAAAREGGVVQGFSRQLVDNAGDIGDGLKRIAAAAEEAAGWQLEEALGGNYYDKMLPDGDDDNPEQEGGES
jgi:hypothetical protein